MSEDAFSWSDTASSLCWSKVLLTPPVLNFWGGWLKWGRSGHVTWVSGHWLHHSTLGGTAAVLDDGHWLDDGGFVGRRLWDLSLGLLGIWCWGEMRTFSGEDVWNLLAQTRKASLTLCDFELLLQRPELQLEELSHLFVLLLLPGTENPTHTFLFSFCIIMMFILAL